MKDYVGQKYGRIIVVSFSGKDDNYRTYWNCICDCGKELIVRSDRFKTQKSCGCKKVEDLITKLKKHGMHKTSEYHIWENIKSRCTNKNNIAYKAYGGRGIKMCGRWLNSFENFLADAGRRPSPKHSIDRFPNNNGNYEPNNIRWATMKEQSANRRNNVMYSHDGMIAHISEWSRRFDISCMALRKYIKRHSFADAYKHYTYKNGI